MAGTALPDSATYLAALSQLAGRIDPTTIGRYRDLLFEAWRDGRHVFVLGNGSSACTTSHHVCDYVKTASVEGRPRLAEFADLHINIPSNSYGLIEDLHLAIQHMAAQRLQTRVRQEKAACESL